MGQMFVGRISVKSKGDDLHSRIPVIVQKLPHLRCHDPQILRDDAHGPRRLIDHVGQLLARPRPVNAVHTVLRPPGHCIIPGDSDKMVDAQSVIKPAGGQDPLPPPFKILLFHSIPVIKRIAPELPGGAERVRRHARDEFGHQLFIQKKQLRMCPHIRAVQGGINGNIPDDPDPLLCRVIPEPVPLLKKLILTERPERDLLLQEGFILFHCLRTPETDILVPFQPAHIPKMFLTCHIQAVIPKPVRILPLKYTEVRCLLMGAAPESRAQYLEAILIDRLIGNGRFISAPGKLIKIFFFQQSFLHKDLQIDKIRIARVGGKGLVRAVPVAGRPKGQHLPVFLPRCPQKIHKLIGGLSEGPDPIRGRKTGNRQQDPRSPL